MAATEEVKGILEKARELSRPNYEFCYAHMVARKSTRFPAEDTKKAIKNALKLKCTTCANCCRQLSPVFTENDIKKISKKQKKTPAALIKQYFRKSRESEGFVLRRMPCPFLKDNKCSIYSVRPDTCKSFPHLSHDDLSGHPLLAFENTRICPQVFLTIKELRENYEKNGKK